MLAPALVHRSWCAENLGHDSNERLEFLGDAVLGVIITDHAFHAYPALSEGELTDVRKAVVNAVTLAEVADELDLGQHLLLGKGEEQSGGREKPSILADALEAVLGAVYVSAGMETAHKLVMGLLGSPRGRSPRRRPGRAGLQEPPAGAGGPPFRRRPQVRHPGRGPDHARRFHVTVSVAGKARGEGDGRSKKQAEQVAARDAYTTLVAEVRNDTENA